MESNVEENLPIKVKKAIFAGNTFIKHMFDIQTMTDTMTDEGLEKLLEDDKFNISTNDLIEVCEKISKNILKDER